MKVTSQRPFPTVQLATSTAQVALVRVQAIVLAIPYDAFQIFPPGGMSILPGTEHVLRGLIAVAGPEGGTAALIDLVRLTGQVPNQEPWLVLRVRHGLHEACMTISEALGVTAVPSEAANAACWLVPAEDSSGTQCLALNLAALLLEVEKRLALKVS